MNWFTAWFNGWFLRGMVDDKEKEKPRIDTNNLPTEIDGVPITDGRPRTLNIEGFLRGNKGEKFTAQEIAKRMGLTVAEVNGSINKLVRDEVVRREPIKGDDGMIRNYISYIS
jgi:Fic family protein